MYTQEFYELNIKSLFCSQNLQMLSPSKRVFVSPPKPSPPEDFDTNSQDSGYSESGKKIDDDW